MTLLKRLLTSIVLFVPMFVVVYLVICAGGGAIAGARAGVNNPDAQDPTELGRQAGENFVRQNLPVIAMSSLGISLLSSLALSFSGLFPWCRNPAQPPKLPTA